MSAYPQFSTTAPSPSTARAPVVTVEARGLADFHVSARGGAFADCHAAILDAVRALAAPTVCPDCGETMDAPGELFGRDHYLCRDCAAAFHAEQSEFAALLDAAASEAA